MPIRRQAEEMRDLYANEIAAAVAEGRTPAPAQIESCKRYCAAALAADPTGLLTSPTAPEARETDTM